MNLIEITMMLSLQQEASEHVCCVSSIDIKLRSTHIDRAAPATVLLVFYLVLFGVR